MIDRWSPTGDLVARPRREALRSSGGIWLIEDNAETRDRQKLAGVHAQRPDIVIQVHRLKRGITEVAARFSYGRGKARTIDATAGRAGMALELLDTAGARTGLVVAGATYGSNRAFIPGVRARGLQVAAEVRHDSRWFLTSKGLGWGSDVRAEQVLLGSSWQRVEIVSPESGNEMDYSFAELGLVTDSERLRAFVFAPGLIVDCDGDLRIGITSLLYAEPTYLVQMMGWIRWIRTLKRRRSRLDFGHDLHVSASDQRRGPSRLVALTRPNITLARRHDEQLEAPSAHAVAPSNAPVVRRRTVVELFAGAGGLGLGFLLSGRERSNYRLICSAEVEPIYVQTLKQNHALFAHAFGNVRRGIPRRTDCIDLRTRAAEEYVMNQIAGVNRLDVLMGGPPCQGFSNANRNNWSAKNPNNRLVDVFLRYVRKLHPRYVLLENVQGILWTGHAVARSPRSVADHVAASLTKAGYLVFPKLLDAVWYGVPQHRARFFLLAIHADEGYRKDDFGEWGPFPLPTHGPRAGRPYVTVADAIGDLPIIENGASSDVLTYAELTPKELAAKAYLHMMRLGAARRTVTDHVASRHARYVIERYREIPEGGNWQNIAGMMTNYSAVERTHSNIYRRLRWDEPAITIGHYRKSMLVHPEQHRGISLREAARLQSFPDWFRFAGTANGEPGGLMHKQQQLANAVCPLVSKAVADFLTLL